MQVVDGEQCRSACLPHLEILQEVDGESSVPTCVLLEPAGKYMNDKVHRKKSEILTRINSFDEIILRVRLPRT